MQNSTCNWSTANALREETTTLWGNARSFWTQTHP
jgi:hypothetical protein